MWQIDWSSHPKTAPENADELVAHFAEVYNTRARELKNEISAEMNNYISVNSLYHKYPEMDMWQALADRGF